MGKLDHLDFSVPKAMMDWNRKEGITAAWIEAASGRIAWGSPSFNEMLGDKKSAYDIFEFSRLPLIDQPGRARLKHPASGRKNAKWYEVLRKDIDDSRMFLAIEATDSVETKTLLSEFVQTLTSTFALLSTGLAIFDKNRNLLMFNPALCTLTRLDPVWLSRKPNLSAILDKMRDDQTLGEPRDFKSWRESLPDLVQQAANGTYEEIWNMASGQIFRVIGRPHPRGAIALLFEDITSEISQRRRHRMEVELSHNALDASEEALCVFAQDGTMMIANKPFTKMWGMDPSETLLDISIIDATKIWSQACEATPIWGDAREFVTAIQNRATWSADIQRNNGDRLALRVVPMLNGATYFGFCSIES